MNFENFLEGFQKVKLQKIPFVVVTITQNVGSIPQVLGARMIVTDQGNVFGTVGGGAFEKKAIDTAIEYLNEKKASVRFVQWNLQKDLGMACGGAAGLLFEMHFPENPWQIAVFGAGHVAQELIPLLLKLECTVTCIDSRSEWLEKLPATPRLKKVLVEEPANYVSELNPKTFVVVMTMGHKTDLPIATKALSLQHTFPYFGVIGSDSKALSLRSRLKEAGIEDKKIDLMICPLGEDFGKNVPAEIVISITAQLLRKRDAYFAEA